MLIIQTIRVLFISGIYFVWGEEKNIEFHNSLIDFYHYRKEKEVRFTLFPSSDNWDRVRKTLKIDIVEMRRYTFSFNRLNRVYSI